jgi:3-hydroxyacyl-[acyl-carrier-protein] dehydratase
MRKLPYRHPMLLIDRVTSVVPGERLTACKAVTISEPWFGGSGLGSTARCSPGPLMADIPPVFPAVLLIESLCQAAGLLAAWDAPKPSVLHGDVMLLGSLADVTLHASVEPGSIICHEVRLTRSFGGSHIFEGTSTADGRLVLRVGQLVMAIRPAEVVTGRAMADPASHNGGRSGGGGGPHRKDSDER